MCLKLFFIDFETQQGLTGKIVYGSIIETDENYNIKNEYAIINKEQFIDFFFEHEGVYIAHNGGRFDFPKVFNELMDRGAIVDYEDTVIKNGRIFSMSFLKPNSEIMDSYPLFLMALRSFAKAFQLKEGKGNFDVKYIDPFRITEKDWEELKKYCKQDVYILIEGFKKFENILRTRFGMKKHLYEFISLPQVSFDIIRARIPNFKKRIIPIDKMREAYSGGRTEIYKLYSEKPLYYYDANSLYPTVMVNHEYPLAPYSKIKDIDYEGIVKIRLNADQPEYYIPPVPYKLKVPIRSTDPNNPTKKMITYQNIKLFFPNIGNTIMTITTPEARLLEKMGYNFEVLYGIGSPDSQPIFDFMKDMYDERLKHKGTALSNTIKLIMNSGYGKFGQKREVEIFDGKKFTKEKRFIFCNTIIASLITANARVHMYNQFRKVGLKNIYYTDTDSLITDRSIDDDDIGSGLGKFKKEYAIEKYMALLPKTYFMYAKEVTKKNSEMKMICKAKGFRNIEADDITSCIKKIKDGQMNSSVPSLKSILKNKMDETFWQTNTMKTLKQSYDKRKVIEDWDTEAYKTEELDQLAYTKWAKF